MALDPAIKAVMQKINKKQGAGTVILGSEITQPVRETITTGSLNLDVALGGGLATDHWNEIIGHESAGKSLLTFKLIAANQALDPKWTVVWFATEYFDESYAQMLGADLDRIIVENENTMEKVYEHCIEFLKTRAIDCIVIDSYPALVPAREEDATMEDFQPGLAAFLTGKFFRMSNPSMKRSLTEEERPVTGIIINQWREKIGSYGDPRTAPGGKRRTFSISSVST
jgi:recombination protein RecA